MPRSIGESPTRSQICHQSGIWAKGYAQLSEINLHSPKTFSYRGHLWEIRQNLEYHHLAHGLSVFPPVVRRWMELIHVAWRTFGRVWAYYVESAYVIVYEELPRKGFVRRGTDWGRLSW